MIRAPHRNEEDAALNAHPIPHAFFKSVLTEDDRGRLHMWSFMIPNVNTRKPLADFLVPARKLERWSDIVLWQRLVGREIELEKNKIRTMWKH